MPYKRLVVFEHSQLLKSRNEGAMHIACVFVCVFVCVCVCVSVCLSSLVCMVGVIYVYVDTVFGFYGYFLNYLVGCFSMIVWTPAVLSVL